MLSKAASNKSTKLLFILNRFQSTTTTKFSFNNSNQRTHPLTLLNRKLTGELNTTNDLEAVYNDFNTELSKLNNINLSKSFSLNQFNSKILKLSIVSTDSKLDPYVLLDKLCEYQLARSQHFEILMNYYLDQKRPQDVLNLWIKYLSMITENPNTLMINTSGSMKNFNSKIYNPHENIIAITMVAYLLLPNNNPDLNTLNQILQLDSNQQIMANLTELPVIKVEELISSRLEDDEKDTARDNFNNLVSQYMNSHPNWLPDKIQNTYSLRKLRSLHNLAKSNDIKDTGTVLKLMERALDLASPRYSIDIYSQFKDSVVDLSTLNDFLLVAVANLGSNSKRYKLTRIQALWNDLIKKNITENSYTMLFKALLHSKNFNELESVWNNELPENFKANQLILESYLNSILNFQKVSFNDIKDKLPNEIQTLDLVNNVLKRVLYDPTIRNRKVFDDFYTKYFENKRFTPNIMTVATKLFADFKYTKDRDSFKFMANIPQNFSEDFSKFLMVLENFIKISPTTDPIHQLFNEVKLPLNSKKYKIFIDAEFFKNDGSTELAEVLFEEYLDLLHETKHSNLSTTMMNQFIREVLDSMVVGYCHVLKLKRPMSQFPKLEKYYKLYKEISCDIPVPVLKTLLATFRVAASKQGSFLADAEVKFIERVLLDISKDKRRFRPNQKDLDTLREKGIKIPEKLEQKPLHVDQPPNPTEQTG
ncbi:hypothetical protein KAFR_0C05100 [Kazachstania africana CBS 2517]|uniref:Mitochondrial group I intron splicing factor CCM1 n=1 Tax=Kazachstania africana (strain ATCC 22294 / BCRC 22015 / CBS 2517 / CECT 1963 / NBRC 1671 / NRRL Y-8276) TaxID=1071382 RepID=H2AT01_KAZAF|nr:hypothetical protein KAFR_0C05100 [Kazachstania africana CBS 2517]CCF57501.1 hypothetical protein KAFR_0C05100 [Kazachstania africana CBS 2517]